MPCPTGQSVEELILTYKEVFTLIDFNNASFAKLTHVKDTAFQNMIAPMLIPGEAIIKTFRGIRDGVVFTNKRIITINVQGITGMKKDFTSLPYSKLQAYSVETAGAFDLDCELELWFSGLGKVKLEFMAQSNIIEICRMISEHIL